MMNKNERFVITINRELGSGGRTVGRKLAEKLGVEFCDKTVIKGLQQKFNLSVEEIEKQKGESNSWWAEVKRALNVAPGVVGSVEYVEARANNGVYAPTTDDMFKAETMMLQEIAEQESFVVAGRSGFYIFRNHPNHVSILIQASMPFRLERVMRKQGLTEEEARKIIEQVDKMRENYVNKYTKTSRYDTRNYDLVISADGKTEDELVEIILKFIG
jgi:cytidylate kinase